MSTLPKGVQFKTVKPQGFYQEYRDYYVTPVQTYSNVFNNSDIVRIQFNLQDWYIDPYESFIEAEVRLQNESTVDFNAAVNMSTNNPIQFLMMDGPSTSLLNDFRLEVNSKEIERIREYDQVGNLLTDLNMYPESVDQKDFEGYFTNKGKKTVQGPHDIWNYVGVNHQVASSSATSYEFQTSGSTTNIIPNMHSQDIFAGEADYNSNSNNIAPVSIVTNTTKFERFGIGTLDKLAPVGYTGTRTTFRSPVHVLQQISDARINPVSSPGQFYHYGQFLGQLTGGNSNYGIHKADYTSSDAFLNPGIIPVVDSPKLSQIDGHNIFLSNLPTAKIIDGKFQGRIYNQSQNTAQTRAFMQIPLLSGVMGVLIPQERWQLIPSNSLGQVNMEFRFNPNAFFSHNGDALNWTVSKFQLRLRLYKFDAALMGQLKNQVAGGIQMHSQIFSMGPTYNIQPTVSVTNNWQLNNGIPSIKKLMFWFLSDDYQSYNYCRKNYKLSQNVTSMQLKVGSTFIPQNPIIGHSGNIIMNTQKQLDNSIFLSELHQSMNLLFDSNKHININKVNFAINERPYDVTLYEMMGIGNSNLTDLKRGLLRNAGYTMWNELRCRGKAVYSFNLEGDKYNDDTMTGIDTTKIRPIELILKSDDPNTYPRNSTMYVMFLSDFIVTFGSNETMTEGQG